MALSPALFAGLFLGVTTQIVAPASAFWQILSFFSVIGPLPVLWLSLQNDFARAIQACAIAIVWVIFGRFIFDIPYNLVLFIPQVAMILIVSHFALLNRKTPSGEEWFPTGLILTYMIGVAVLGAMWLILLEIGVAIPEEALRLSAKQMTSSSMIEDHLVESMQRLMYFYPAILMVATFLIVLANTAMVQKILERQGQNIRPLGAFGEIRLPTYYLWVTAAAGLVTLLGMPQVGLNSLLLLLFGFFLVGLTLVHEVNRIYKLGTISLVVFYIVMILFGGIAIFVCLAGIMEPWLRTHVNILKIGKN